MFGQWLPIAVLTTFVCRVVEDRALDDVQLVRRLLNFGGMFSAGTRGGHQLV